MSQFRMTCITQFIRRRLSTHISSGIHPIWLRLATSKQKLRKERAFSMASPELWNDLSVQRVNYCLGRYGCLNLTGVFRSSEKVTVVGKSILFVCLCLPSSV